MLLNRRSLTAFGRQALVLAFSLGLLAAPGCIASNVVARPVVVRGAGDTTVAEATKAQLTDGSVVVFQSGVHVANGLVLGDGWRFQPTTADSMHVNQVPVDSVSSLVAFRTAYDPAKSAGMTVAAGISLALLLFFGLIVLCSTTRCMD